MSSLNLTTAQCNELIACLKRGDALGEAGRPTLELFNCLNRLVGSHPPSPMEQSLINRIRTIQQLAVSRSPEGEAAQALLPLFEAQLLEVRTECQMKTIEIAMRRLLASQLLDEIHNTTYANLQERLELTIQERNRQREMQIANVTQDVADGYGQPMSSVQIEGINEAGIINFVVRIE